jgi:hypothetical protein
MSYQSENRSPFGMSKKQFNTWSQILLKHLIDSVRFHVSSNKKTTHVIFNNIYIHTKDNTCRPFIGTNVSPN